MDILEYWAYLLDFINIMLNHLSQNFESFLKLYFVDVFTYVSWYSIMFIPQFKVMIEP